MTERVCHREACRKPIGEHMRADSRYCSKTCRREAARERAASPDGTKPFNWLRYRAHLRTPAARRGREQ